MKEQLISKRRYQSIRKYLTKLGLIAEEEAIGGATLGFVAQSIRPKKNYKQSAEKTEIVFDKVESKPAVREEREVSLLSETPSASASELDRYLLKLDKPFNEVLFSLIDSKGLSDSMCYNKANIDRRLFSKIRSDSKYQVSKATAIAFGIALELKLPEFEMLLSRAGFSLNPASIADMIVRYYVEKGVYDFFEINNALITYDQKPITNY